MLDWIGPVVELDWTCSPEIERSECRCSFHFIFIRSVLYKLVTLVVVPRRLPLCRLSVGRVVQTYQSRHGRHSANPQVRGKFRMQPVSRAFGVSSRALGVSSASARADARAAG